MKVVQLFCSFVLLSDFTNSQKVYETGNKRLIRHENSHLCLSWTPELGRMDNNRFSSKRSSVPPRMVLVTVKSCSAVISTAVSRPQGGAGTEGPSLRPVAEGLVTPVTAHNRRSNSRLRTVLRC